MISNVQKIYTEIINWKWICICFIYINIIFVRSSSINILYGLDFVFKK